MNMVRALFRGGFDPTEILRAYDIWPQLADLGPEVAALVYRSRKGRLHVLINQNRNAVDKARSFLHELYHSAVDMPKSGYVLGLDMQWHGREVNAEAFVREAALLYAVL